MGSVRFGLFFARVLCACICVCSHMCSCTIVKECTCTCTHACGGPESLSSVFYIHYRPGLLSQGLSLIPASLNNQLAQRSPCFCLLSARITSGSSYLPGLCMDSGHLNSILHAYKASALSTTLSPQSLKIPFCTLFNHFPTLHCNYFCIFKEKRSMHFFVKFQGLKMLPRFHPVQTSPETQKPFFIKLQFYIQMRTAHKILWCWQCKCCFGAARCRLQLNFELQT